MSSESYSRIVRKLGEVVLGRLERRLIRELQQMPGMLSGDHSGLDNVWDEVCVQTQYDESVSWQTYQLVIRGMAEGLFESLEPHEQEALWWITPEAEQREDDVAFGKSDAESPRPLAEDSVQLLIDRVLSLAGNWSNSRIRSFADRY